MITSFYLIICHSRRCFQPSIYILATKFKHIINTTTIRLLQNFHYYYYRDGRLLADGMRIFHLECYYCFITVLDRGPQPSHPWYSLRTCLYHILLQTLCQQSDETLFGCFIIALNVAFTHQLSLADEGCESGSNTIDLPTPLRKTPHIHHVSSMEHTSFNPVTTMPCSTVTITPCSTPQTPPRPVHRCLSFSSDNDQAPDSTMVCSDNSDEEEDFQTVLLDDKHWTSEETPERTFCIHKHGLPHNLCQYPCPYGSNNTLSYMDSLDLSDILDYEDHMVTSSDEEILGMEEVPY